MITALEGGEGSASRPGHSLPRERPGTHCTGGWILLNLISEYFLKICREISSFIKNITRMKVLGTMTYIHFL
jgi:hypothetical protein